ncbi:hypothetical protein DXN04_07285 [Chitinophaga silvisoli]|uniref:DUF2306 domain-containing protein n=1 Tax=Chitinophaga silvisoli TaxID=2291814 RepID=A0A3E1P6X3_9BACT|nr:hypothetical protein DXN04_07285 [Chitinophaga silvisoli]
MSLSVLGAIHTIIAIVAIIFAIAAFIQSGKIQPGTTTGNYYSILTVLACLTAFGLSKAGGFNPGHALSILILVFLGIAYLLRRSSKGWTKYIQNFLMTTTLLLSLIPAVNETLTRIPLGHPLATDISSPAIAKTLMALLVLYVVALILQSVFIRKMQTATHRE